MDVMMPVAVVSQACRLCPRLQIYVEKEYSVEKIVDTELECMHYEECLQAVEMYERGRLEKGDGI